MVFLISSFFVFPFFSDERVTVSAVKVVQVLAVVVAVWTMAETLIVLKLKKVAAEAKVVVEEVALTELKLTAVMR